MDLLAFSLIFDCVCAFKMIVRLKDANHVASERNPKMKMFAVSWQIGLAAKLLSGVNHFGPNANAFSLN